MLLWTYYMSFDAWMCLFLLDTYLSMEFLGLRAHVCFGKYSWAVFQSDCNTTILPECQNVNPGQQPRESSKIHYLKESSSDMCVAVSYCDFNFAFLCDWRCGGAFHVFIVCFGILAVKCLFTSLNHILLGYLFFSYWFGGVF